MRSVSGLTVLELILAMALAGVLAGVATLAVRNLENRWKLETAIRQVVLDLRMARVSSISQARAHRLRFDENQITYYREVRADNRNYVPLEPTDLPRGVRVLDCSARGSAISFQPRGNAGTFGTLTLVGPDDTRANIVVDMVGRVRVRAVATP